MSWQFTPIGTTHSALELIQATLTKKKKKKEGENLLAQVTEKSRDSMFSGTAGSRNPRIVIKIVFSLCGPGFAFLCAGKLSPVETTPV